MPTFTLPSCNLVGLLQTVGRVLAGNLHLVGFTVLIAAAAVLWFAAARHVPAVIPFVVACLVLVAYIRRSAHCPPFVMAGRPLKIGPRRALWWLWSRFGSTTTLSAGYRSPGHTVSMPDMFWRWWATSTMSVNTATPSSMSSPSRWWR